MKRRKKRLGKPTRILLNDASENVVAKCSIHRGVLDLGVLDLVAATIYATRPRFAQTETAKNDGAAADVAASDDSDNIGPKNDDALLVDAREDRNTRASSDKQQQDKDVHYYPWFQVNAMGGSDHSTRGMYSVSVWTESSRQFEPFLKILPVPIAADMKRKNEGSSSSSLCFTVVDYFQGQLHLGVFQPKSNNQSGDGKGGDKKNGRIQVDIAPGVDPAMMICLAAVINDMAP